MITRKITLQRTHTHFVYKHIYNGVYIYTDSFGILNIRMFYISFSFSDITTYYE